MDNRSFDNLARVLARAESRRSLLRGALAAGVAALLPWRRGSDAAVICLFPLVDCGDGCTDVNNDPENCGSCGNVCDTACFSGSCLLIACLIPQIMCDGECVDPDSDPNNCGECGNVCDFACIGGVCGGILCPFPEQTGCGGECVDISNDSNHCGGCGIVCEGSCLDGECVLIACEEGETGCGDYCANLSSDVNDCGACGNVCEGGVPAPGHSSEPACEGGVCVSPCLPDADSCGNECTDFGFDSLNCGGCGIACTPDQVCCSGVCRGPADAERYCDNCGMLGGWPQGCLDGEVCQDGICLPACADGQASCEDGCVDLSSDSEHCGACGTACDAGEECNEGACGPPGGSDEPVALWQGETKLRGANILQWDARATGDVTEPGQPDFGLEYTSADFEALADLGANVVVINHPAIFGAENEPALDNEAADNLDRLITMAADASLYSVIALRTGPGYPESALTESMLCRSGGCPTAAEDESPASTSLFDDANAQESWRLSWQEIASRYQDDESVIGYQLMSWVDPDFGEEWTALAASWIEAIREDDADKPILVPVPEWPEEGLAEPLTDDQNAIHTIEFLLPERYLTQSADESDPLTYPGSFDSGIDDDEGDFARDWIERQLLPLLEFRETHDKPIAISAFGAPRWQPGIANFIDDLMTAFEGDGFNHALWAWYPESFELDDAFDPTRGPDPDNHEAVENDLLDVIAAHWSDNTEEFAPDED